MPGTVKSELLSDADRSHKCDSQEKVCWIRHLSLDKSHFITGKSMDKKILTLGNPIIKYNQDFAFLTSAMHSDMSFYNWLLSNAIQVYYVPKNSGCNLTLFYLGIEPNPINNIPLFDHQIVKMDFLKKSSMTLIEFTELMIKEDYYVTNTLDEYYIETRLSYQKEHFDHGILIYGFDSQSGQIFTAGYDNSSHFQCSTISYETYDLSFRNTTRNSRISCFKRNGKHYEVDRELIKQLLYDFVNSYNTSLHYRALQNPLSNYFWGMNAFRQIVNSDDIRNFSMLYEYILFMAERANYFGLNDLGERLKKLSKKAGIIINLTIKSKIKKDFPTSRTPILEELLISLEELLFEFYDKL